MSPHNFYFIYLIHYIYLGLFTFCFFYMSSALLLLCPPTPEHVPPPLLLTSQLGSHHLRHINIRTDFADPTGLKP